MFIARAIDVYRRSLRAQLQLALGLMLVTLVAVGAIGWGFLHNSSTGFDRISSQVTAESAVQNRLRNLLGPEHSLAQAYVTRRDVEARDEFRRIADQIDRSFAKLAMLYAEHGEKVGSLGEKWKRARASAERAFAMPVLPADDPSVPYPLFTFHDLADSATGDLGSQQAVGFRRLRARRTSSNFTA